MGKYELALADFDRAIAARREVCLGHCESRRDLPAHGQVRAGAGRLRPRHRPRPEVCLGDCQSRRDLPPAWASTSGRWPTSIAPSPSTRRMPGRLRVAARPTGIMGKYEQALADFDQRHRASTEKYAWAIAESRRDLPAAWASTSWRWPTSTAPSPSTRSMPGPLRARRDLPAHGQVRAGAGRLRPRHRPRREVCLGDCPVAARPTGSWASTSGRWPTSTAPSLSTRSMPGPLPVAARPTGCMGKYEQALADFDQAIALDAKDAWAIASRGETYRLHGQVRAGAGRLRPRHRPRPEGCLGHCQSRRDLPAARATTSGRWPTSTRPSPSTRRMPGPLLTRRRPTGCMGEYERALADFDRPSPSTRRMPGPLPPRRDLPAQGEYEQALADFDQAIALDPDRLVICTGGRSRIVPWGRKHAASLILAAAIDRARRSSRARAPR